MSRAGRTLDDDAPLSDSADLEEGSFADVLREVARAPSVRLASLRDVDEDDRADLAGRTFLHFTLIRRLGRGGMGTAYRARDERLHREVMTKVLTWQVGRRAAPHRGQGRRRGDAPEHRRRA